MTGVQDCRDFVFGPRVAVRGEAAFENAGGLAFATVAVAESEFLWGGGVVVQRPYLETKFGGEAGEGVED